MSLSNMPPSPEWRSDNPVCCLKHLCRPPFFALLEAQQDRAGIEEEVQPGLVSARQNPSRHRVLKYALVENHLCHGLEPQPQLVPSRWIVPQVRRCKPKITKCRQKAVGHRKSSRMLHVYRTHPLQYKWALECRPIIIH